MNRADEATKHRSGSVGSDPSDDESGTRGREPRVMRVDDALSSMSSPCHICGSEVATDGAAGEATEGFECDDCGEGTCIDC